MAASQPVSLHPRQTPVGEILSLELKVVWLCGGFLAAFYSFVLGEFESLVESQFNSIPHVRSPLFEETFCLC